MATKSILTNVDVKGKKNGRALVNALEHSKEKKGKEVTLSRTYSEAKGSMIKLLFGERK